MNSRLLSDQLDDAVDRFEENWGANSYLEIPAILADVGLGHELKCVTELIRVDIQLRYAAQLEVNLWTYFESYQLLQQDVETGCLIAFEDYRTRIAKLLPVSRNRWSWIDGVKNKSWFLGIEEDPQDVLASAHHSIVIDDRPVVFGTLRVEPDDLAMSMVNAGFSVVRQIGIGAFSRVFLATQESLANRQVVIKAVLRPFQEADRLAQLQHTNIVPIYSYHRTGRWSLLCMPYAGLITLADYFASASESKLRTGQSFVATIRQAAADETVRVKDGALDMEREADNSIDCDNAVPLRSLLSNLEPLHRDELALWFFSHLSAALAHAHARNILHGDLKPANILLRSDGEPALLDFNLSTELDGKETREVGGTLPYMAPELMRALIGEKHCVSATSDIYSLGAVFYQFLTGRLPYPTPRSSAAVDLQSSIDQRRLDVEWHPKDRVSPGIRSIVASCLAPAPEKRYASAEQLHEDMECERNQLPLKHAREVSFKHRIRKWMKRHPTIASVGSLTFASLAIVTCLSVALWEISEHRRTLFADSRFIEFEEQSQQALAGLLAVGRHDRDQAVNRADQCLALYDVMTDVRWQMQPAWKYLSPQRQQIASRRLTDLLLRTAWGRYESSQESTGRKRELHDPGLIARAALLNSEPFFEHAPNSIEYLQHTISRRLGDEHSRSLEDVSAHSQQPQANAVTPLDVLGKASLAIERLNSNEAMRLLTPDLLKTIDPYTYWLTLGRAQSEAGFLPAAELSFSMAIESYLKSPAAFHYRGVCRMKMRSGTMTKLAIADFSAALEIAGHAYETRINRAMAKESQGDLKGALNDLGSLAGEPEVDAQALMVRSRIHRKLREHELAKQDFDAALQITPQTVSAWLTRALARLPHDAQGAIDDLRAAETIAPQSIEVLQNLAHVYSEHMHAPEQAVEALTRLLDLNPTYERALLGRAVVFARMGDYPRAIGDLQVAERSRPQLTPAASYQAACVHALLSNARSSTESSGKSADVALTYLSRAVQQGYGADLLSNDDDLNPLRSDSRFQTIVSAVALGRQAIPQATSAQ